MGMRALTQWCVLASGLADAQHHLQRGVQAALPHVNEAISKIRHFVAPYVSQAEALMSASPVLKHLQSRMQHMQARIQGGFQHSTDSIDASLHGLQPWQVAATTAVVVVITMWILSHLLSLFADVRETGMQHCVSSLFVALPCLCCGWGSRCALPVLWLRLHKQAKPCQLLE